MSDNKLIKATDQQSGTITQKLEVATTTAAYVTPVPDEYPGTITLEPGTVNEETVYFKSKDDEAGTINELTRDYTLRNGGTGIEHQNGASWETLQNTLYLNNIVDAIKEGFYQETNDFVKVDTTSFTVVGNKTTTYNTGRTLRLNESSSYIVGVVSSSYSAGTGLTTVVITGAEVPTLTNVEIGVQPGGLTALISPKIITSILDTNDNELIKLEPTTDAVNEVTITNAATGGLPTVEATGSDEAIPTHFKGKAAFNKHSGVKDLGTVGATETVSWANGDRQKMTLDEDLTITFSNAAEGQTVTLYMLQDGSGGNTPTFADTIVWADATEPTWTTDADSWNIAVITYVGGEYLGVGNAFA